MAKEVEGDNKPTAKHWRRFSRLKVNKTTLRRHARKLETATVRHAHRFLVTRWTNVRDVGRLASGWLVLVGLLIGLASMQMLWYRDGYTTIAADHGGTYAEGFVGQLETMNPLFASTPAEVSASKLLFSGLLRYDDTNTLTTDVAESWNASPDGKVYEIVLRKDVSWHDGQQLTAADVVFTVNLMKNEQVKALQYSSWAGVKVEKIDDYRLQFILPSAYAPFAQSLTFGILPKHILQDIAPADLRENTFGRSPTGSGPFVFRRLQVIDPNTNRLVVHMEKNKSYYRSEPLLNRFQIHTYETTEALSRAYTTSEITAAVGLSSKQLDTAAQKRTNSHVSSALLNDGVFALLNADSPLLSDTKLRQALVAGTDRQAILAAIHERGVLLTGPLPNSLVTGQSARQTTNTTEAAALLDAAGWHVNKEGVRSKDGALLSLNLVAPDDGDYGLVVNEIARQWGELGIKTEVELVKIKEIAATYLQPRNYDVLVYELVVGADPDVYPYWHSSQANAKSLNFANYRSGIADDILSSARSQSSVPLRQAKYQALTEQWVKDAPAVALYQPMFSYVADAAVISFDDTQPLAETTLRYRSVQRWAVQARSVMNTP